MKYRIKRFLARLRQINEWIATHSVAFMASMECVYLFTLWSILPSLNKNLESIVFYISGGVIQLVALPLIMVGQRLEGKRMDQIAEQDHETLQEILTTLRRLDREGERERQLANMFNDEEHAQ